MPSRVDANITINFTPSHGNAVTLRTASFEIWSDKCIFYTRQAEPVLEHIFHNHNDRTPINLNHGTFEVTFIQMVEVRYRDARHRTRPRYKFEEADHFAYKSFHSKFANRLFVGDVATTSVTGPRSIKTREECIKLWQAAPASPAGVITVPLQVGNGSMQLFIIESRWIESRRRAGSKGMHIQLRRERSVTRHRLFTLGPKKCPQSSHAIESPVPPHDEELLALLAHFDQLSIEASTKPGCDELEAFLKRCLDEDQSAHGQPIDGERAAVPDPRQPRPELLQNARFYHQRLRGDNIRLLNIHHGRGQEPISIDLHTVSLRSASTYEALSYCWAAWSVPAQEKTVTVNGEPGFFMSAHLWNALRRLRSRNTSRYLWIDAFCINQGDEEERTQQISLMGQIYQKARRTIIWISEFNDTDLKDTCKRNGAASGDADAQEATLCAPTPAAAVAHFNDFHQLRQYMAPLYEREELTNAGKVWWKRLWCVQEFFFSQEQQSVYVAQHALTWDQFLDLMDSVRKDTVGRGSIHKDDDPLILFRELRDKGKSSAQEGFGLHYLLRQTGKFHCGMPCDRIYALLGMTSVAREYITPDTRDPRSPSL
ncbi:hypothetical protein MRB53_037729 [Persea americana]|nr:hypothetical protein MRB53_037729 [Persea americana]